MNYVFPALTVAAALVMLVAMVLCFKAPAPRFRWLWVVAILLGYVHVFLRPTDDGTYKVLALSIANPGDLFLESKASEPPSEVFIPIGALAFLVRRRWLVKGPAPRA